MPDGFRLRVDATAQHLRHHAELPRRAGNGERLPHGGLPGQPVKVLLHRLAIDDDGPAVIRVKTHLRNGPLAPARAVEVPLLRRLFRLHRRHLVTCLLV